jgi:hypothetical protein
MLRSSNVCDLGDGSGLGVRYETSEGVSLCEVSCYRDCVTLTSLNIPALGEMASSSCETILLVNLWILWRDTSNPPTRKTVSLPKSARCFALAAMKDMSDDLYFLRIFHCFILSSNCALLFSKLSLNLMESVGNIT